MFTNTLKQKLYDCEPIRFFYQKNIKPLLMLNTFRNVESDKQEIQDSLREFQNWPKKEGTNRILISGHIGLSPRTPFLAKVLGKLPDNYEMAIIIENGADYERLNRKKWPGITDKEYQALKQFIAPSLFLKDTFVPFEKVKEDINWDTIKEKKYLKEAYQNLTKRHFNMHPGFAGYLVLNAYRYLSDAIQYLKPDCVIMWNEFFAFHHILDGLCKEKAIARMYFEFGVLPGTYALESLGQMGESYPSRYYAEFKNLPVTQNELQAAENICHYIKDNRLNRKVQEKADIEQLLKKRIKKGRPILFYAGQNDFESGICPYTDNTKKFHSPIFESSDDAILFLAELAKKNDWNIIYKMHPLVTCFSTRPKLPGNVILINNVDINDLIHYSDLTITILSQTAYAALFNEKPVLMLGYMQLRGKGCTYETFAKDKIESAIQQALKEGYTAQQRKEFIKHIAQVAKYYVFNDPWFDKQMSYGLDITNCANRIYNRVEQPNGKR